VEQQGESEATFRINAGEALAILSIHSPNFLMGIRTNLRSTLWDYGFALSPEEMKRAEQYLTETAQLSDDAIIEDLESKDRRW
jgi:hypothetical protein